MSRTLTLLVIAYWLLIALPWWWFSVAFGAPLVPQPTSTFDGLEAFFLASLYLPIIVLMYLVIRSRRLRRKRPLSTHCGR